MQIFEVALFCLVMQHQLLCILCVCIFRFFRVLCTAIHFRRPLYTHVDRSEQDDLFMGVQSAIVDLTQLKLWRDIAATFNEIHTVF